MQVGMCLKIFKFVNHFWKVDLGPLVCSCIRLLLFLPHFGCQTITILKAMSSATAPTIAQVAVLPWSPLVAVVCSLHSLHVVYCGKLSTFRVSILGDLSNNSLFKFLWFIWWSTLYLFYMDSLLMFDVLFKYEVAFILTLFHVEMCMNDFNTYEW